MFVHFGMFFKTVLSLTSCYPKSEDSTAKSMLYTVYEIEKNLAWAFDNLTSIHSESTFQKAC